MLLLKKITASYTKWIFYLFTLYFQWYVNCINLVINLILPTLVLGILNYYIYKVLNRNQVQAKQLRRNTVDTEDKLRKRDIRLVKNWIELKLFSLAGFRFLHAVKYSDNCSVAMPTIHPSCHANALGTVAQLQSNFFLINQTSCVLYFNYLYDAL